MSPRPTIRLSNPSCRSTMDEHLRQGGVVVDDEHAAARRFDASRSWRQSIGAASVAAPGSAGLACAGGSVAVEVRLVGALDVDAEVVGLLLGELGQLDAEGVEVQPGDLLVEVLGQDVTPSS